MWSQTYQQVHLPPRYQNTYEIFTDDVFIQPLNRTAKLAVVVLTEEGSSRREPFFVVSNFRSEVLATVKEPGGSTFGVTDDTFKRALTAAQVVQVACGSKIEHAQVVERLKALSVVGSRSSRFNLAALKGLLPTLSNLKKSEHVSKKIVDGMYSLIPPNVLIDRPGRPGTSSTTITHTAQPPPLAPPLSRTAAAVSAATAAAAAISAMHQRAGTSAAAAAATTAAPAMPPSLGQQMLQTSSTSAGNIGAPSTLAASNSAHAAAEVGPGINLNLVAVAAAIAAAVTDMRAPTQGGMSFDPVIDSEPLPNKLLRRCYRLKQLMEPYGLTVHLPDW